MRVAYVCADPGVPVFGRKGCSIHVQEILRASQRRGNTVDLFAARIGGERPPGLESIVVHRIPRVRHRDATDRQELRDRIQHANAEVTEALRKHGPYRVVYERYSLWCHAGMEYARDSRDATGILEVNAPLIEEEATHRGPLDESLARATAGRTFRAAKSLVAVSREVARYLREFPETDSRVHVVPNGVDPARFAPPGEQPAHTDSKAFRVGFVGTLKPWHGLSTLVDAFSDFHANAPESRLVIVGAGPEHEELVSRLAERDVLAACDLAGSVAPPSIPGWLAGMDVAVAPYQDAETFYFSPLKVLEYMAAGLAIVCSRCGQLEELIRDGVEGILCSPGDARELAAALELLRGDPALRARLGRAARAKAETHHSWDTVLEEICVRSGLPKSLAVT